MDAEELLVFYIKIHVDQPIDRQQLMQELLELKSEFQLDFLYNLTIYFGATNA